MTNVVIVAAGRTAVGSFNGSFANTPAHDLGAAVIEAVVARAGIDKAEVEETILGHVLTSGQGHDPARPSHINARPANDPHSAAIAHLQTVRRSTRTPAAHS